MNRAALVAALLLQFIWHASMAQRSARQEALQPPPPLTELRTMSLGESLMMSRYLMLYLQSLDIQPGIVIAYRDLDYGRVTGWLEASLELDEKDAYPLFAASHIYAGVRNDRKKRMMLDFIYRQFLCDPDERWPWLASGALTAKYELHDLRLALKYSEALRNKSPRAPNWVREMSIFTLEDMNELESAKILIGGLLAAGKIRDPNEIAFLEKELMRIGKTGGSRSF